MSALVRGLAIVCSAAAVSSCTQVEKIREDGSAAGEVPAEVQRVFDERCAMQAGCHSTETPAAELVLTAAQAQSIIGGQSKQSDLPLVEPGDVNGSYLAAKILAAAPPGVVRTGVRMPIGGTFTDPDLSTDLAIILGWIAGADLPADGDGNDDVADDGGTELGCSIFTLAPGVTSPVMSGIIENTLPMDIGDALDRNCGCHYSTTLMNNQAPYTGPVGIATFAQFQEEYAGSNPAYSGLATYEAVVDRITDEFSPMPPLSCMVEGGGAITDADRTLLVDWLTDGAPDAPTWSGMPGTGG
ncbi:MAG: hypothetical protein AAF721_20130 [Myxococcota bacterium]